MLRFLSCFERYLSFDAHYFVINFKYKIGDVYEYFWKINVVFPSK